MATEPHNFKILLFLLYGHHQLKDIAIPELRITLSLHNFKLLLLLIGILGVSNPTFFWDFWDFWFFYVSILANIISNNTVLQCYLLWIFVSIRRVLQLIVCIGVSTPSPHPKNISGDSTSPKNGFFMHPPPSQKKIGFFSELS